VSFAAGEERGVSGTGGSISGLGGGPGGTGPRVIAGVSGSPGSIRALRHAAEVALQRGARLVPVLAWTPPGGDLADRQYPSAHLRQLWREAAADRLREAIDRAFGGMPADLPVDAAVIRGPASRVLVAVAGQPGDLIVVGTGGRGVARRLARARVVRYCVANAACPVIAVPPAELEADLRGLRGWARRHRAAPEDALLPAGQ
jgi:nucleotide-binding universal stress UspA family protein